MLAPNPMRTRPTAWMVVHTRVVSREPSRSTTSPDAATDTKDPSDMHSRINPTLPGVSDRPSRIAGMRETQVANTSPEPA